MTAVTSRWSQTPRTKAKDESNAQIQSRPDAQAPFASPPAFCPPLDSSPPPTQPTRCGHCSRPIVPREGIGYGSAVDSTWEKEARGLWEVARYGLVLFSGNNRPLFFSRSSSVLFTLNPHNSRSLLQLPSAKKKNFLLYIAISCLTPALPFYRVPSLPCPTLYRHDPVEEFGRLRTSQTALASIRLGDAMLHIDYP